MFTMFTLQCLCSWNCMRLHWTWIREPKERNKNKHVNRESRCLAPASTSGKWSSSQIINDTLPIHNYAQTQRDTNKILTPPWQRGFTLLTGFATLVVLLIRVKEQRYTEEEEIDGGAQVWAKHSLSQNRSRLLRTQQVITLHGVLAAALLLPAHDYVALFDILLCALRLYLVFGLLGILYSIFEDEMSAKKKAGEVVCWRAFTAPLSFKMRGKHLLIL